MDGLPYRLALGEILSQLPCVASEPLVHDEESFRSEGGNPFVSIVTSISAASCEYLPHRPVSGIPALIPLHKPRPPRPNHSPARTIDLDALTFQQPHLLPVMFARNPPPATIPGSAKIFSGASFWSRERLVGLGGGGRVGLTLRRIPQCPRRQRRPDDRAPLEQTDYSAARCPPREARMTDGSRDRDRLCMNPTALGREQAGRVCGRARGSDARRFQRTGPGQSAPAVALRIWAESEEGRRPGRRGCRAVVGAGGLAVSWASLRPGRRRRGRLLFSSCPL